MSVSLTGLDKGPKKLGQILLEEGAVTPEQLVTALDKQQATIGEVLVDIGATDSKTIEKALEKQSEQAAKTPDKLPGIKRSDIRVDLIKLDKLVNLVGELVIAETMVTRNPDLRDLTLENFDRAVHHLRRVTSELQDVAMSVRMIPLSMTFQKLVRVVHDLSRKVKKKVKLTLLGEETEVDKTMTEQIADPLLHMVRNSVDHGLETTEERLKLGKPETGKITIEARYEGGEVWIIVSDDGRGLNRDKILAKATERGLVKGDSSHLTDDEVFSFIFEPGFSTSSSISEVSGRGVGMDVVRKNIEKLKGRISIRSRLGFGTSIYLQIPLTLAIIDGMLVKVGDSQYTIPLLSIRESVRPTAKSITITPEGEEIVRIREDMIPVIRLHKLHNKESRHTELHEGILVIVEDQGRKAAIFVDEIIGQQQTVIKGLSNFISMVQGISGCTILGDGAVSLILDIGGLIEKAGDIEQKFY
jgi:two-component system chemotaxis sensor kinase CheA